MSLRLSLENVDMLPDGGPVSIAVDGRNLEIGRLPQLDWTLPDPTRTLSGRHCEIRFQNGAYWLHDVSRNGTFVNGSEARLVDAHRLKPGDRLLLGPYIVRVEEAGARGASSFVTHDDPWAAEGEIAEPEARAAFRPTPGARLPDFLDTLAPPPPPAEPAPVLSGADVWGAPPPPPPPPALAPEAAPVEVPVPRRPEGPARPAEGDLLALVAEAAGLGPDIFAGRDPATVAAEIGAALRISADRLCAALHARDETRMAIRSASRSTPRGPEINPLDFAPDGAEALTQMFAGGAAKRLRAPAAVERAFADLDAHQLLMLAATRETLERLFEDLSPDKIETAASGDKGLGALVASRKARLWDVFVERWRAVSRRSDGRLNEAFMALIGEVYDRLAGTVR